MATTRWTAVPETTGSFAGDGDDLAIGGAGDDRIFLGHGDDLANSSDKGSSDAGDDFIRGGAGNDIISDAFGNNTIRGDTGHDFINTIDSDASQGTPDKLHGGWGHDTLIGDAGDQLTGGEGTDTFAILAEPDEGDAPAVLTDFDPKSELFGLVFESKPQQDPDIIFEHDPTYNKVTAIVNGRPVAVLADIDAWQVPYIQTFMTTLPEAEAC